MRKRRKSDDILNRKRQKRALKEARRSSQRQERIKARNQERQAAQIAALEELKKQLIEDWEKKFDG